MLRRALCCSAPMLRRALCCSATLQHRPPAPTPSSQLLLRQHYAPPTCSDPRSADLLRPPAALPFCRQLLLRQQLLPRCSCCAPYCSSCRLVTPAAPAVVPRSFLQQKDAGQLLSRVKCEDHSELIEEIKKYNLLKGNSLDELIDTDLQKRYPLVDRHTIRKHLVRYKRELVKFEDQVFYNLFREYLVKNFSHTKEFYDRCAMFRYKELPKEIKEYLLKENGERHEQARREFSEAIRVETMREVEEDAIQRINEKIAANAALEMKLLTLCRHNSTVWRANISLFREPHVAAKGYLLTLDDV